MDVGPIRLLPDTSKREAMKNLPLPKNCMHENPDGADWQASRLAQNHKMTIHFALAILLLTMSCLVNAECVEGALTKSKFNRMNSHNHCTNWWIRRSNRDQNFLQNQ